MAEKYGKASFVGIDWGTSSFRAYRVAAGERVDTRSSDRGILSVPSGGHAAALRAELAGWVLDGPIILSGMIGSRQGWREAPYAPCPATLPSIAGASLTWAEPALGTITLLPGLVAEDAAGIPDVMRGEETQIFGAMRAMGRDDGTFVLPGTHSKHALVKSGAIRNFATYMTGEIFGALKAHTILGRLMADGPPDGEGFHKGVREGAAARGAHGLLHRLFATRTLGLFDRLPATELSAFLSGALIGAELQALDKSGAQDIVIVGSHAMARLYRKAGEILGFGVLEAPGDCAWIGHASALAHLA